MQVCELPKRVKNEKRLVSESVVEDHSDDDIPMSRIVKEAYNKSAWGLASSIDIYNCNPDTIRDAEMIRKFVVELCDLIEMKRFQDTLVVNFGEDERVAGFSMVQLIETSLISAHFANLSNTTYLDVFSCKPYDPRVVEKFAMDFFGGTHCRTHARLRM